MRLRYLFILTFCLVTLVPMVLFWAWPYSKALESELDDVKERHLVIAKNLSGTFERYYQDVTGLFSVLDMYFEDEKHNLEIESLFTSYGFKSIMLVSKDGKVRTCIFKNDKVCQSNISPKILNLALKTIVKDETKISTVTEDKNLDTGPILLVVKEKGNNLIIGYLSTSYIIKMGKKVAFGKKGHAAIVDQEGNVLSHPLNSWIESMKNISKVSAVEKMLAGKTGVEIFYSPALKSDMIAGYTVVPRANWGVMVPQPLDELKNKAKEIDETAFFVMILGLSLALLITISISFILIRPIERLSEVIKLIEKDDSQIDFELKISRFLPTEIKELKNAFIQMMYKIQENKKSISQLAYVDMNTGLPNRNYFYELINQSFEQMSNSNEKGALVFIDFDGFKKVNDTYGHRAGDELLAMFAQRLMEHFSFIEESKPNLIFDTNSLPLEIPARLGGDEFVILFRNIKNKEEVEKKVQSLFEDVFTEYNLYGDVHITLTGSAGIALYPQDGSKYNKILKSADTAMYAAKAAGKNTIRFYQA